MTTINQDNNLLAAYWQNSLNQDEVSRVPAGYVEAEALSNSRNSQYYMDSGLLVTNEDEWEVTCKAEPHTQGNLCVMGGGHSKTDSNAGLWIDHSKAEVEFIFGNGSDSNYKVVAQNVDMSQWHTYKMNLATGQAWIDGVFQGTSVSKSSFSKQRKLALFSCWRETNNSVISNTFFGKVREYIVRRNGNVMAHFIPCKHYIGTESCGMYDLCNNVYRSLENSYTLFSFHVEYSVTVTDGYQYSFHTGVFDDGIDVDWGDGTKETLTTSTIYTTVAFSHTYASAGTYSITIDAPYTIDIFSLGTINSTATNAQKIASVTKLKSRLIPKSFCRSANNATVDSKVLESKYYIGEYAFYAVPFNFDAFPEGLFAFGTEAFRNDAALTITSLPDSILQIGQGCFYNCTNLALTSLPNGLTEILKDTFRACSKITLSSLPSGVTSIGETAFYQCSRLALSEFPSGLISIDKNAFCSCSRMTVSSFPNTLTTIGYKSFDGCSRIAISAIPPLVTRIENYTFRGCTGITSFTIPNTVTYIGEYSFSGCTNLLLSALPTGLLSLGQYAFNNCTHISITQMPSTCTMLAAYTFNNCTSMAEFTFGAVMSSISVSAFTGCASIADIYCPWYEGDVDNAPWGATNATVHYLENNSSSSSGEESSSSSGVSYEPSLLPAGYIDTDGFYVEYQSSKPYLDTGLNQSMDDIWEIKYAAPSNYTNNVPLIGSGASKTSGNCAIWVNNSTGEIQFIYGNGSVESYIIRTTVADTKTWHIYKMNLSTGEAWLDGASLGLVSSMGTISSAKKLVLFGCWRNTSNFNASHGVIGYCKITRSGTLVREFVPFYRWSDGKSGLYDLCNNTTHLMSNNSGEAVYSFRARVRMPVEASYQHEAGVNSAIGNTATISWGDGSATLVSAIGDTIVNHTYSDTETCQPLANGSFMRYVSLTNGGSTGSNITQFLEYNGKKVSRSLLQGASNVTASDDVLGSVYAVDENAFRECSSLAWTILPDVIKYIGQWAFYNCSSLALTELPSALEYIGESAFNKCSSLAITQIPSGVTYIGEYAFNRCSSLTSITFLGTPTTIGNDAFNGCTNLTTINVPWSSGDVSGAPWGATNATINYNYSV